MGHIFVSYSKHDQEMVDRIVEAIEQAGFNVWIDREEVKAGKTWRTQIVQAIDTCDAFVLMLSSNSAASDIVRREVDLAEGANRALVPILLEPTKLPAQLRYQLAGLKLIDLQNLGFDTAIDQLFEILKEQPEATSEQTIRQVELVIEGIDLSRFGPEKRNKLLDVVSEMMGIPQSQLQISNSTSGLVQVGVPEGDVAAFDAKIQEQLRDFISNLVNVPKSQLVFSTVLAGDLTTDAPPPKPKKKPKAK